MTSNEIRQSFLDFFKSKQHTIVPSASLLPDSPNLFFTNAGMNQFVPIFLGQRAPDVSKWAGAVPGKDTRAADTQKCIRAGGKHNDLDDVGLDTYHHTFFEMLGNWSFGDYFKKEAIDWAWELIVHRWHFPPQRLYATVFCPPTHMPRWESELDLAIKLAEIGPTVAQEDVAAGSPSGIELPDREAAQYWVKHFNKAGLDPREHIIAGNRKDNFWMMGETGPCGPCSEIHFDLTPQGDTKGRLVNQGSPQCIEIWNLVFIQFNANADGSFSPLPAKHVDTGMGLDRVTSFIQCTKNFTDFNGIVSNYETDAFRPLFDKIEKLSGKKYSSTLPPADLSTINSQQSTDIAFRVIADHIRTLGFAIADGINPSNEGRGYVLRRILRRAVRYGRTLDFHEPFFYKLVDVLAEKMGQIFPEIRAKKKHVEEVIQREEEAFNKTLDKGIELFMSEVLDVEMGKMFPEKTAMQKGRRVTGSFAFKLYDTYGFPLDLTELIARERGFTVDVDGFNELMEEQKTRARAAQKKTVVTLQEGVDLVASTNFVGYDQTKLSSRVLKAIPQGKSWGVILPDSPFYAEMGGQVGDTGTISADANLWPVVDTKKVHLTWLHIIDGDEPPAIGTQVTAEVDISRRNAIQRHHTVTHLLHWALHEVVNKEASQKGSFVGPDKLTFDFNSAPLTPQQVADIEKLVNERILENAGVSWKDFPYADVKSRKDVMQFFGDKYGDMVRVVQIGGRAGELNGYSMELCGGTHTRATGEIGLFRIVGESAIAAGVRRIEGIAGLEAYKRANEELQLIKTLAGKVNSPVGELEKKVESLLTQQKELEKQLGAAQQKQAGETARGLVAKAQNIGTTRAIVENLGAADGDLLQSIADALKGQFKGVVVLGGATNGAVSLVATVSPELSKQIQAGKIIQTIAPIVGGKGGGRPDNARGGGKDVSKLDEALAKARSLIG